MRTEGCTKREIWKKYTGRDQEHGQILNWMRQFASNDGNSARKHTFVGNISEMAKKSSINEMSDDSFENLQLKKRITELEHQLKDAEMKAIAFSTMVDIAEKQFNIPIRKKVNTKP